MSFNSLNFILARGISNENSTISIPAVHLYGSIDDTISTISTNGYFDNLIPPQDQPTRPNISPGINDSYIEVGDFIFVRDSASESTFIQITQVIPTVTTSQNAVDIPPGSIGTVQLADGAVTNPKLADNAVSGNKIADSGVANSKLITITDASKIGANSVSNTAIQDNAVTTLKIANTAVTEPKLADNSVSTRTMVDGDITTAKIGALQVTRDKVGLDVFTEQFTIGASFSGPWAAPISYVIPYVKSSKTVTLLFPTAAFNPATTSALMTFSQVLPMEFRPATDVYMPISVVDNSAPVFGLLKVDTLGAITIGVGAQEAAFANTGNAGLNLSTAITYATL